MRSAEHVHITTRRTMLAGIAIITASNVAGAAKASDVAGGSTDQAVPTSSGQTLLNLWHERCRCEAERDRFDEFEQPDQFWFWENRRCELERQIITSQVRCLDDLRGKIELARRDADPTGSGVDDDLVISIATGFDHLFPRG